LPAHSKNLEDERHLETSDDHHHGPESGFTLHLLIIDADFKFLGEFEQMLEESIDFLSAQKPEVVTSETDSITFRAVM